jgi:hypothetical protein
LGVIAGLMALALTSLAVSTPARALTLNGTVVALNGQVLAHYNVTLYASSVRETPWRRSSTHWSRLGSATTDRSGAFRITYSLPPGLPDDKQPVLFVEAERDLVMLASAIGRGGSAPSSVVVNELTTVATANAFAQFIDSRSIDGNPVGMINAVRMAANLANPQTGEVGTVLGSIPNGTATLTLSTFNSLANVVASCVANPGSCDALFKAATSRGGRRPANVLEALANIVKSPSYPGYPLSSQDPVFQLSLFNPVYTPALTERPTSWLLFLKFTGGPYTNQDSTNLMNGPGNVAIDADGFAWVNDNYIPKAEGDFACAGNRLIKFYPWGENFPGSPYFGGGLSGAGFGVTVDPRNRVWVGNFGFEDPPCQFLSQAAPHNSVSAFNADGTPISGPSGFTEGNIYWPQGTVSDGEGNIWVANCGNDSVTKIPRGVHARAVNIPLASKPSSGEARIRPFGAAIDLEGNVWFTGNRSNTVSVISPSGKLIGTLPGAYRGRTVLSHPVGNAADSAGNIWVSNSDWVDSPCPSSPQNLGPAKNPSITMFQAKSRIPYPGSPFTGGGLTLPWGIAVDGNDTVWAFNFGVVPVGQTTNIATGISRFCGINTRRCPPGLRVGDPISPHTGYRSNALTRLTGGRIDPSGNLWLMNNWKLDANPLKNPGGNSIVIVVGAAGPIKTPLTGPPVPFE